MKLINSLRTLAVTGLVLSAVAGNALAADAASSTPATKQLTAKECSKLKTDEERNGAGCMTNEQCSKLTTSKEKATNGCYVEHKKSVKKKH